MPAERVRLDEIKTLSLFSDRYTQARRTDPIPQLTCVGKACSLYQPDAALCYNVGGQGTDVNWKCEADLPEALRFGRVTVSCEGWSRSGDPYVLKGSCGLEYRLVEVPGKFNSNQEAFSSVAEGWTWSQILFFVAWWAVFFLLLWGFIGPCINSYFRGPTNRRAGGDTHRRPPFNDWFGGSGGNSGRPGNRPPSPPPPYSKNNSNTSSGNSESWRPGFWTGLGLGGAAATLANQYAYRGRSERDRPTSSAYDWERRDRVFGGGRPASPQPSSRYAAMGMGEGSSRSGGNLGQMRRATGIGESNVR